MTAQPDRGVDGNIIYSTDMPNIRIQVDSAFQYVGNLKFILYDVAWVDIYYFIEAEGEKIKRTFHVQFEGYLPNNTHSYNYPSPLREKLGDQEYIYDANFGNYLAIVEERPDSDVGRGYAMLREKGYDTSAWVATMRDRYVRLLDEAKRNEILLIYSEPLWQYGYTPEDVAEGGRVSQDWESILRPGLHQRGLASFRVTRG